MIMKSTLKQLVYNDSLTHNENYGLFYSIKGLNAISK